jgi:putative hemolysin
MSAPLKKYVDVRAVFSKKNPRLARWIPGIVFWLIARLVKEKEMNAAMSRIGEFEGIDFCRGVIDELGMDLKTSGLENVPKEGGVILVANHPLGGPDGIALMLAVSRMRSDMVFLVNDVLMHVSNLQSLFVPVNKLGRNSRESTERIESAYASDKAVLIFPAGLVSRKQNGKISDVTWSKSFVSRAVRYKRSVIPVFIEGRNSRFFYNFAYWRKRLGIKVNLEMFLLPREMFGQKGKTVRIVFGKPVAPHTFELERSEKHWAAEMRKAVYQLNIKVSSKKNDRHHSSRGSRAIDR